jgi:hypothetical protein
VLVKFISVGSHLAQKSFLKAHDCSLLYMCACKPKWPTKIESYNIDDLPVLLFLLLSSAEQRFGVVSRRHLDWQLKKCTLQQSLLWKF